MGKVTSNSKTFQAEPFRLRHGKNMAGDKTLWLDLNGSSYAPTAINRKEAKDFANILRLAADWVDAMPKNTFHKDK